MDWMKQLGGVVDKYGDAQRGGAAPATVDDDFDQVSRVAPRNAMADGLAAAFRSDKTPPFASMAAQMFGRAGGAQRAGMLQMLLASVGPLVVQQILARRQQQQRSGGGAAPSSPGGDGIFGDILGKMGGGGSTPQITPESVQDLSPEVVEEIAAEAEKKDPSIVDKISDVYAEQPQLLKILGGAALAIALGRIAQKQGAL